MNVFEKVCNCYAKEKAILYRKRNNTAKKLRALRAQIKSLKEESQKSREEIKEELKSEILEKISWGMGQVFKMGVDCGSDEKKIEELKRENKNLRLCVFMIEHHEEENKKLKGKHERATRYIARLKKSYNQIFSGNIILNRLGIRQQQENQALKAENDKIKDVLKRIKAISYGAWWYSERNDYEILRLINSVDITEKGE